MRMRRLSPCRLARFAPVLAIPSAKYVNAPNAAVATGMTTARNDSVDEALPRKNALLRYSSPRWHSARRAAAWSMTAIAGAGLDIIIPATGTTQEMTAVATSGRIGALATKMIVTIVTATNTDNGGTSNLWVGCGQTGVSPVASHFA